MAERRAGRGPAVFRQRDLTRAMRAARAAGQERYEIVIEAGKMVVRVGGDVATMADAEPEVNEWDGVDEAF